MHAGASRTVEVTRSEKGDGTVYYHTAYQVDGGLSTAGGVQAFEARRRYSEFDELRLKLERLHGAEVRALPFPPKHLFGADSEPVLRERAKAFDEFLKGLVQLIAPAGELKDGSAEAVLWEFLVSGGGASAADGVGSGPARQGGVSLTTTAATVLFFENQRAGSLGEALRFENPSEEKYSASLLLPIDAYPWSCAAGCERPDPGALQRASATLGRATRDEQGLVHRDSEAPEAPGCPAPGWVWTEEQWRQGSWEYRGNFIGAATTETSAISAAGVHGDWETSMSTSFGNKSWVRRRRWTRRVERDSECVWSGCLDKLKVAGFADRRWFMLTGEVLSYYQLVHEHDNYEDLGAPLVQPRAAANNGAIPLADIQEIAPAPLDGDTFDVVVKEGRTFTLRAADSEEVEKWVSSIEEAAGRALRRAVDPLDREEHGDEATKLRLCSALEFCTGADDWLDPVWERGAAGVLTASSIVIFDSTPKMVHARKLADLLCDDDGGVREHEAKELHLGTVTREDCIRLAFETSDERDVWASEICELRSHCEESHDDDPHHNHYLLPVDAEGLPAEKCVVHVHVGGNCRHGHNREKKTMERLSQHFVVRPGYLGLFSGLSQLQNHMTNPCMQLPVKRYDLKGMTVKDASEIELSDGRVLTLTGAEGVPERICQAIRGELSKQDEEGSSSCRVCTFTHQAIPAYLEAVKDRQEQSNYVKGRRQMEEGLEEMNAEHKAMLEVDEIAADSAKRTESFVKFTAKIVKLDWEKRDLKPSSGSRMITPALENMVALFKSLLQSDADAETQAKEFVAVSDALQEELAGKLKDIDYDPAGGPEERRDLRLFLLAWLHNCVLLDEQAEELLDSKGIEKDVSFYDAARCCQDGVTRLYRDELDHKLTYRGQLFTSAKKELSPMSEATEFFFSACVAELQIQVSGPRNSPGASRLCRKIGDDLLSYLADCKYFAALCAACLGPAFPSISQRLAPIELRDFRFVLKDDLEMLERVYRQLYAILSESIEERLTNLDDDDLIDPIDVTRGIEDGLRIHQRAGDLTLPYPLIVEEVTKRSVASRALLQRGMVIDADQRDGLRGERRFLQLELSATILALGEFCEELDAVRLLADAVGDDAEVEGAYLNLARKFDAKLAYGLVSSLPTWGSGVSERISAVDTSAFIGRKLSARSQLHASDPQFEVRWWNNARGPANHVPVHGTQFLTLRNQTGLSLTAGLEWQMDKSEWWQKPPVSVPGDGQAITWAAATDALFGETRGAVVFKGKLPRAAGGESFAVVLGWSTPCLAFSPLERRKLLKRGYTPDGYPRKAAVLVEHGNTLRREEQLELHVDPIFARRQSRAQCHHTGIQVRCEVLTKVDKAALVYQLESLNLRSLQARAVELGVWTDADADLQRQASVSVAKEELIQEVVRKLCGDFAKQSMVVTDKDVHQCVFTVSRLGDEEKGYASALNELTEKMNQQSTLIGTKTYEVVPVRSLLNQDYENCFIGTELVDWLVNNGGRALSAADWRLPSSRLLGLLLSAIRSADPTTPRLEVSPDENPAVRRAVVAIGQEMIELGMIRHVKDEHDFKDEALFYRTNYVPYEKKRSKKGYLEKRPGAGALKLFEKRWFELEAGTGKLHYYKEEFGKKAGQIPPAGSVYEILIVRAEPGSDEVLIRCGQMRMSLMEEMPDGQGRTFVLRAGSAASAQEWANAIEEERNAAEEPETEPMLLPVAGQQQGSGLPRLLSDESVLSGGAGGAAVCAEEAEPPPDKPPVGQRSKRAKEKGGGGFACCGSRPK